MQSRFFDIDTALLSTNCVVRRFREGDGEALHALTRSSHIYLDDHYPALAQQIGDDVETAETFARRCLVDWLEQRAFVFGVWDNETTNLQAYVSLHTVDWEIPAASLAIFGDLAYSQPERLTEIMARTIRFGFLQLGLEKISFLTVADNYLAQRVARKAGMSREGDLRNEFRRGSGILVDAVRFGLSRETYGE